MQGPQLPQRFLPAAITLQVRPLSLASAIFELAEGPELKAETVRTCRAR